MSGQDIAKNSGFTGCLSKAGVAIGSTTTQLAYSAPNGAGVDYCIDGRAYHAADDADVAMTAMSVQAVSTSCLYCIMLDASGTLSTKKGKEELTASLGDNLSLQWPQPDEDKCAIGYFRVDTSASVTFTGGTTALDAAGITDTYYDCALGIPSVPLTS